MIKIFSIAPFNRMAADDFSYASTVVQEGFIRAQVGWYMKWSGRFFATFMQTLFGYISSFSGKTTLYTLFTFSSLWVAIYMFVKSLSSKKDYTSLALMTPLTFVFFLYFNFQ